MGNEFKIVKIIEPLNINLSGTGPKNNLSAVTGPTVNDDINAGYSINSHWIDVATGTVYVCVDSTAGAAVWQDLSSAGATDHGALTGLADDDHTQYLNETRHDALAADNPHSVTAAQVGSPSLQTMTDEAILRADGTTGEYQDSLVFINDTGQITVYDVAANIKAGNYPVDILSAIVNGSGKTALKVDTTTNVANTEKLASLNNNGFEKFAIFANGAGWIGAGNTITDGFAIGSSNVSTAPGTLCTGYSNQTNAIGAFAAGLTNVVNGAYAIGMGLSNQIVPFFAVGLGSSNSVTSLGGGSVAIGASNYVNGGFATVFGIANKMYASNAALFGNHLLAEAGVASAAILGSGFNANIPAVTSRSGSINIGSGKSYNTFHSENDIRSYLETPNFGIFSEQNLILERVSNGSFTGSASGWTLGTGWAYGSNDVVKNADGTGTLSQAITLEKGCAYLLSYDLTTTVADETIEVTLPTMGITLTKRRLSNTGNKDVFIATSETDTLTFTPSNLSRFTIDNISIKKMNTGSLSVAGEVYNNGALWVRRGANAFGTSSAYTTLVLDGDTNGAGMYFGRADDANEPFTGVSGYDSGVVRQVYYGGGGWDVPDATDHVFYSAPTYTETNNTASQRFNINGAGYIFTGSAHRANNMGFQIYQYDSFDGGICFNASGPSTALYNMGPDASDSRKFKLDTTTGSTNLGSGSNIYTYDPTTNEWSFNKPVKMMTGTTTQAPLNFPNATALKTTPADGDMEYKDGHWYLTNGARHVISTSAGIKTTTTTVANTVTETQIYAYTFAANELHADERITFTMDGSYSNDSASDDWTMRFKVGGTTVHTISRVGGNVTDAGWEAVYRGTIRTDGASGTFVDFAKLLDGTDSYALGEATTHSIDTTGTVLFEVTLQWDAAKAGNTFSCTQADLTFKH